MQIEELIPYLRGRVVAFTGAGISAASGVPTFRGAAGLYSGTQAEDLASPEGFARDPVKVWNWYLMRIHRYGACRPNAGHMALAELATVAQQLTLVTSNVDDLHDRAGTQAHRLHGNISQTRCTQCRRVEPWVDPPESVEAGALPTCRCGGLLRPNVVWFGEFPMPGAIQAVREHLPLADLVLEIGVSGVVSYGFTETALVLRKPVIRINPEPGLRHRNLLWLAEGAETALPRLVSSLEPHV